MYFQPIVRLQIVQEISATVCTPVTRCRWVGVERVVLGRVGGEDGIRGLKVEVVVEQEDGVWVSEVPAEEDEEEEDVKLNVYANAVASTELLLRGGGAGTVRGEDVEVDSSESKVRLDCTTALAGTAPVASTLGETRYARPCLPVNPLLMIWLVSAREALQRAQEMCEVWPLR